MCGSNRMLSFFKEIEKQIDKENEKIVVKFSNFVEKIIVYIFLVSRFNLFGFRLERNSYFNISFIAILEKYFWQFDPVGVTGILMIAESHFSIHTWPEDHYAAFDILTCGKMYPEKAIELIKEEFEAQTMNVQVIERGY